MLDLGGGAGQEPVDGVGDREVAVGELDDGAGEGRLVECGLDEGGHVVAADVALDQRRLGGDPAGAGAVGEGAGPDDDPGEVGAGEVGVGGLS